MIDTSKSYKSLSNREKGKILENLVSNTLLDFSELGYEILNNIRKSRGDTDHVVINHTRKLLYIIETKNVNNDFRLYSSWFKSHVVERFTNLPQIVHDYLAKGYKMVPTLIISKFTVASEIVHDLIKKYGIVIIEVGKQLLKQSKKWASLIKIKLKCLLKLGNNNKLIKDCNGLKNISFDSNMTGIDLKSFKFSNYLKGENYGIKLKTLHKECKKWIYLLKRSILCLLKLGIDYSVDHNKDHSSVSNSLDLELNNNFERSECHIAGENHDFRGFSYYLKRPDSICSRFQSAISICISALPVKMKSLVTISLLKEKISKFISDNRGTLTLIPVNDTDGSLLYYILLKNENEKSKEETDKDEDENNFRISFGNYYIYKFVKHSRSKVIKKQFGKQTALDAYFSPQKQTKKKRKRKSQAYKREHYLELEAFGERLVLSLPKNPPLGDKKKDRLLKKDLKRFKKGINEDDIYNAVGNIGSCYGCSKAEFDNSKCRVTCDTLHNLLLIYDVNSLIKEGFIDYGEIKDRKRLKAINKRIEDLWYSWRLRQHNCFRSKIAFAKYLDCLGAY